MPYLIALRRSVTFSRLVLSLSFLCLSSEALAQTAVTACRTIATTGSYILTRNIPATGNCIVIAADGVTLNLNGFTIRGANAGSGITDNDVPRTGLVIRNGTIRSFITGITAIESVGTVVEDVTVSDNTSAGLQVGSKSMVRRSKALRNGGGPGPGGGGSAGVGIDARSGSLVSDNVAANNFTAGILVDVGSTVIGNVVAETGQVNGGIGMQVFCPSNVLNNTVTGSNNTGGIEINLHTFFGNPCNASNNVPTPSP